MKLNLGCGHKHRDGFIGVDKYPCDAVDVTADLSGRLPFDDHAAEEVWMDNVIEHIPDLPALMREIHRVCRAGARLTVITPHYSSNASWREPTHVHHLSYFSMDYFERPDVAHYTGGGYRVLRRRLSFGGGVMGLIGRMIFRISPRRYEAKWCFIFRASTLYFELEVVKTPSASTSAADQTGTG